MDGPLIFLTGGTGFLGRHMVPGLLKAGYRLRLLARPNSQLDWLPDEDLEIAVGDIADGAFLKQALAGCDYVVHGAAHFRFWGDPGTFQRVNVIGTAELAQAARLNRVKRFVHVSAIAVVGRPPAAGMIDEKTPCRPLDPYQKTKLAAERVLLDGKIVNDLPVVILRPGAFYGPYGRYGFNRLFIEDPLRGLRIGVGGGRLYTFPVYVGDIVQSILLALKEGGSGEVYNICGESVTHQDVHNLVSELGEIPAGRWNAPRPLMLGLAWGMEQVARHTRQEPFYPLNLRHYVFNNWLVDSSKARRELGFRPTPLRDGLAKTIVWYTTLENFANLRRIR